MQDKTKSKTKKDALAEKIDNVFFSEKQIPISKLETFTKNTDEIKPLLNEFIEKTKNSQKVLEKDLTRLYNLNSQIISLKTQNEKTETILSNKKKLYEILKALIVSIEIKKKYANILEEKNLEIKNIPEIEEALEKVYILDSKFKIKAIEERNETVKEILENFFAKFEETISEKISSSILKNRQRQLKTQKNVHDVINPYKNIIKGSMAGLYVLKIKQSYLEDFKAHFSDLRKKLKEKKISKIGEKNDEIVEIIKLSYEMVITILNDEANFLYDVFYENENLDEKINEIFSECLDIFFVFIEKIYEFDRISSFIGLNILCFSHLNLSTSNSQLNFERQEYEKKSKEDLKKSKSKQKKEKIKLDLNLVKQNKISISSEKKEFDLDQTKMMISHQINSQLINILRSLKDNFFDFLRQLPNNKSYVISFSYLKNFLDFSSNFDYQKFDEEIIKIYENKIKSIDLKNKSIDEKIIYLICLHKITSQGYFAKLLMDFQKSIFELLTSKDFDEIERIILKIEDCEENLKKKLQKILKIVLEENLETKIYNERFQKHNL